MFIYFLAHFLAQFLIHRFAYLQTVFFLLFTYFYYFSHVFFYSAFQLVCPVIGCLFTKLNSCYLFIQLFIIFVFISWFVGLFTRFYSKPLLCQPNFHVQCSCNPIFVTVFSAFKLSLPNVLACPYCTLTKGGIEKRHQN